jgi:hypothetical protein
LKSYKHTFFYLLGLVIILITCLASLPVKQPDPSSDGSGAGVIFGFMIVALFLIIYFLSFTFHVLCIIKLKKPVPTLIGKKSIAASFAFVFMLCFVMSLNIYWLVACLPFLLFENVIFGTRYVFVKSFVLAIILCILLIVLSPFYVMYQAHIHARGNPYCIQVAKKQLLQKSWDNITQNDQLDDWTDRYNSLYKPNTAISELSFMNMRSLSEISSYELIYNLFHSVLIVRHDDDKRQYMNWSYRAGTFTERNEPEITQNYGEYCKTTNNFIFKLHLLPRPSKETYYRFHNHQYAAANEFLPYFRWSHGKINLEHTSLSTNYSDIIKKKSISFISLTINDNWKKFAGERSGNWRIQKSEIEGLYKYTKETSSHYTNSIQNPTTSISCWNKRCTHEFYIDGIEYHTAYQYKDLKDWKDIESFIRNKVSSFEK